MRHEEGTVGGRPYLNYGGWSGVGRRREGWERCGGFGGFGFLCLF